MERLRLARRQPSRAGGKTGGAITTKSAPHEAPGLIPPAQVYYRSRAALSWGASVALPAWQDPPARAAHGEIYWQGRNRFIGEAFVGPPVGLKPWRQDRRRVCFYAWLIGEIHTTDLGAMRPAIYHRRHRPKVSAMS